MVASKNRIVYGGYALNALLPLGESAFAGHGRQAAVPSSNAYVSTGHTVHSPPSGP
jgi:hypothetical protein